MIQSLSDTTGKYEFSIILMSLFSSDGFLLVPTDKCTFVQAIEEFIIGPSWEYVGNIVITDASDGTEDRYTVCSMDAMAVVQAIKKGPSIMHEGLN